MSVIGFIQKIWEKKSHGFFVVCLFVLCILNFKRDLRLCSCTSKFLALSPGSDLRATWQVQWGLQLIIRFFNINFELWIGLGVVFINHHIKLMWSGGWTGWERVLYWIGPVLIILMDLDIFKVFILLWFCC